MHANNDEREAGFEHGEMTSTERELAEDAQWKIIQKNTFTRWCNEHLKTVNKAIADLESDFSDGLRLAALVEVLSGKKFKRVNKRPNFRTQKLENVTMTLEFLEQDEGIKIVNIDSSDIVDKKLKLILGLIWTLILHYSISMPMWEGEEPTPSEGGPTPKQRLLNWIQSKVPDLPIKNFTTDWNDGRAIGALVDACGPGLCPDWEDWDKKKADNNAKEAMDAAEKWLDVPQLIKPNEMTNPKVDDLSMMTYLSQFPNAKLKPGAPLRPRVNPARVRAYGPGLEPKGNQVGAPARFTVETFSAGKGELVVTILNPKEAKEPCEMIFNNDRNLTYSCAYVPTMEGQYKVVIMFAGKEIGKSPFTVTVEGAAGDASKVTAKGPGIEKSGVIATKKTYFEVFVKGAGNGKVDVVILDPHGRKDTVRPSVQPAAGKEETYLVEYCTIDQGLHSVNVFFAGSQIPHSPFGVQVAPASNAKACYATGRGIQPRGVRVKDRADFYVHTKGAGDGEVSVQIIGPGGVEEKCQMKKLGDQPDVWECVYQPTKPGNYIINVTFGEQHISKSPFKIDVGPEWNTKVVAYGPGLEGGVVDQKAVFTVETNGETGALGFSIEGPSQAQIDCKDNGDGSADVWYLPTKPGEYAVHILCNEQDIPKSPFMAEIKPAADFNAEKVIAKGPGLEKNGAAPNKWAEFTVDTTAAGKAPLSITGMDADYKPIEIQVKDNKDGTYSCRYMPTRPVKHTISINFGGVAVPNSPFRVYAAEPSDPSKVKVSGPGVTDGIQTMSPTEFLVDCKKAGPGDVAIGLTDPRGMDIPINTINNKDGTFTVEYEPKLPGTYTIMVYFADTEVPQSPLKVKVEPNIDVSAIKVEGLDSKMPVGEEHTASVSLPSDLAEASVAMVLTSPDGHTTDLPVSEVMERRVAPVALQELGPHKLEVLCDGVPIKDSPFSIEAVPNTKQPRVKAHGPGLTEGLTFQPCQFVVDASEEIQPGKLAVWVEGPKSPEVDTKDNEDGTFSVTYVPELPGEYKVNVTYADQPILESPFTAHIIPQELPMVKAYGPGLTESAVNIPAYFTVDTREETRPGKLEVSVEGPEKTKTKVEDKGDGTYEVMYVPEEVGDYKVNVTYGDQPIPESPFLARIIPQELPMVKAYGPGLTESEVNIPACFTVDMREETQPGKLEVSVEGPEDTKTKAEVEDMGDGTCEVSYIPEEVGDYKVKVTHADRPIPGSPFDVKVVPMTEKAPRVEAYGPGLSEGEVDVPACFTVDTSKETRPGDLAVSFEGPAEPVVNILDKGDGLHEITYTPTETGDYKIHVTHGDRPIPESPFMAKIVPSTGDAPPRIEAYGPGLTEGEALKPAEFTVDMSKETRPGNLGVGVLGPKEAKIECLENIDGTVAVSYIAPVPGEYQVNITHADKPIPGSPFKATIKPSELGPDVSSITVSGYGVSPDGVFTESPSEFVVNASALDPKGKGEVQAILTTPSGRKMQTIVDNKKDGTYPVLYTPMEEGPQTLDVTYEGVPVPGSPFNIKAMPGFDANRVRAYGPGLEGGLTQEPAVFTVDMRGAGKAGLGLGIEGPVDAKMKCDDNKDGTCRVEYLPTKPGDYDISVTYGEKPIRGSPFRVKISNPVDASKVKCFGPGLDSKEVTANQPAVFTVDARDAGDAPLEVTYTDPQSGAKCEAEIVPVEEGVYQATYVPPAEGKCKVEVKYGGKQVPKSPFNMRVLPGVDPSKVKVKGPDKDKTIYASLPAQFKVDARDAGVGDLECMIQRPDGTFIQPYIQDNGDGTYDVFYTPEDLGKYKIHVKYNGEKVPGAPFQVEALPIGDASKCKILDGGDKVIPVGKEKVITVDAADAGKGNITCRVRSPSGSDTDIDIVDNGDGTYAIAFTPQSLGDHDVEIKYGGNVIPNGKYTAKAVPEDEYEKYLKQRPVEDDLISADQVDRLQSAAPGSGLYQPVDFCFQVGPIFNFVSAVIVMPSKKTAYPKIEDNRDGTVTVRYQPTETGLHELHVKYNNEAIDGSPFMFHVDAVNSGYVTAYGPGLSHGIVYEPAVFTINTKEAGAGGLALAVEGPSKTEIKCVDNQDGTCTVSYFPTVPGEYHITVKFDQDHIVGSPFTSKILPGEPRKRAQLSVGSSSEVSLKVTETDISDLTATIRSPSGREEPCLLKRLANGHLGITFTPRETGEHLVNVFRNGKHIANSPFKIMVGEKELGNANKVKVSGKGLTEGMANEINEFVVDTREAGYGGMSLSIEGPSKADIECHDNEDGTCRVTYRPTEPGTYIINIKFADQHIPGSPYSVKIGGEPSAKITERITRHKAAADVTHVGSQCELSLKIPGTSPFDMTASVKSPSGLTELCDVASLDDSHYSVKFVPKEMGVHTVSVKHRDMHIPGSPFQFTVGPLSGGGSHKVHAAGPGLERGEVQQPCDFNIYTREAGAGALSIAVEGPSKAEIDFQDRKDGSCGVTYTVNEPGEYYISIKFNDEHIPESPFRVPVTPSIGDARKISITALQERGLQVNKPAAFVVNFNGAKGKLTAHVISPSGAQEEALVQEVDDGEYAVRFIPRENGLHLVHVMLDNYHIPDSPFRIMIGKVDAADAGKVTAYGDGLQTGISGEISKFVVNTVNAGAGALAVTVEGPSKVKLECTEMDEGYAFTYCPKAPGDYYITIRYAGVSVAGSPFKARVEGTGTASNATENASVVVETVTKTSTTTKFSGIQKFSSNASKCVAKGNGLTKAFRGKATSFTVDVTGAGNNILYVGMAGPKSPVDELTVKYVGNNQYTINYTVKQQGQYMLIVRWGEEDIPGSPFAVEVI